MWVHRFVEFVHGYSPGREARRLYNCCLGSSCFSTQGQVAVVRVSLFLPTGEESIQIDGLNKKIRNRDRERTMRGEFGDYICDTLFHGIYEDWEITEYECQRPREEGGEEIILPPIDTLGGHHCWKKKCPSGVHRLPMTLMCP